MSRSIDVINDALRITSILNKHLSEVQCQHTVKEIAQEMFELMKGLGFTRPQNQAGQTATIQGVNQNDDQD